MIDTLPAEPASLVLKPLFSFAGGGIRFAPTPADLAAIPADQRHLYLIQERMAFAPVIDTPTAPAGRSAGDVPVDRSPAAGAAADPDGTRPDDGRRAQSGAGLGWRLGRPRCRHDPAWRYAFAALAMTAATAAGALLSNWVPVDRLPFILYFPAMLAATAIAGPGPGVLAVVLGPLLSELAIPHEHSSLTTTGPELVGCRSMRPSAWAWSCSPRTCGTPGVAPMPRPRRPPGAARSWPRPGRRWTGWPATRSAGPVTSPRCSRRRRSAWASPKTWTSVHRAQSGAGRDAGSAARRKHLAVGGHRRAHPDAHRRRRWHTAVRRGAVAAAGGADRAAGARRGRGRLPPRRLAHLAARDPAPLFDDDGRPRGAIGAFLDVSGRRRDAEEQRFADATRLLNASLDYTATLGKLVRRRCRRWPTTRCSTSSPRRVRWCGPGSPTATRRARPSCARRWC